jgi:hypothetical protein
VPRVLHPEFGYLGTPNFGRRFIVFAVCGLVAGVAGVNVFKADRDPDPTSAMALAPAEAVSNILGGSAAEKGEFAQKTPNTGALKSHCQKQATEYLGGDCAAVQPRKPRSILAINERPPIAAVAIGHRDEPALLPSEPVVPAAARSDETRVGSANTADAVSAAETTEVLPAPSVKETRSNHVRHDRNHGKSVRRRDRNEYSFSSNYRHSVQSGYARLW